MDKRNLIAVALSAAVLILYFQFFYKPPPPPAPGVALVATPAPGTPPSIPTAPAPETQPFDPVQKAPVVTSSLENSKVRPELSSQTGFPIHWWLKEYFKEAGKKGPNIDLLQLSAGEGPLQLVLTPGQAPLNPYFSVKEQSSTSVSYGAQVGSVALLQNLTLSADYVLQVQVLLENQGQAAQAVAPGLRLTVDQTKENGKGFWFFKEAPNFKFPLYMAATKVKRHQDVSNLGAYTEEAGDIAWAGLEDRYFLRIILGRNVSPQNKVAYGAKDQQLFTQFQYPAENLAPGQKKEYQFTLYLGPKDPDRLNAFGAARLGEAIDYGWFGVVARPILYLLKLLHSFLKNWGLAIIFLTILIKILLNPLTKKSMQSMKSMQDLQPQLQKVREKYKDDRERLNAETMALFRTHKVNPMGGCLPMLLQMPIYIALYKVLYNATELYHAPFFWIYQDLSAPDPYFILPILLGAFMVLQQKMSPSMGDPTQAKMMLLMPILFSAFMLFLPLGLVLYIFVNTVMTVAQQYMHQKNITFRSLIRRKAS